MVYIMVTVSPDGEWQTIKRSIMQNLYDGRDASILSILQSSCAGADVICLQEAAASFKEQLAISLSEYHVIVPEDVDSKRNQNSMILLRRSRFPDGILEELSAKTLALLGTSAPVERGDLLVVSARDASGWTILVASFHGDTNGLATKPVVSAVVQILRSQHSDCRLIIGLDANTYLEAKEGSQCVNDFLTHCREFGIRTCWPEGAQMDAYCTTCISRTYLQPQLNKAVRQVEKVKKADLSPKDHILVQSSVFDVVSCYKDNTGERRYIEGEVFPSLSFPSDHGIVCATLGPASSKL
jgi:hypothetical protein